MEAFVRKMVAILVQAYGASVAVEWGFGFGFGNCSAYNIRGNLAIKTFAVVFAIVSAVFAGCSASADFWPCLLCPVECLLASLTGIVGFIVGMMVVALLAKS